MYETTSDNIRVNFNNNKERFIEGKHYYLLKGDELRIFKNDVKDIYAVKSNANQLYLWTKRGASRHCKILDINKAWEQFDCLEENYFRNLPMQTITYCYPVSPSAMESATNAEKLLERIMRREGAAPYEIAYVVKDLFRQVGVEVPKCSVKIPAYEQIELPLSSIKEL